MPRLRVRGQSRQRVENPDTAGTPVAGGERVNSFKPRVAPYGCQQQVGLCDFGLAPLPEVGHKGGNILRRRWEVIADAEVTAAVPARSERVVGGQPLPKDLVPVQDVGAAVEGGVQRVIQAARTVVLAGYQLTADALDAGGLAAFRQRGWRAEMLLAPVGAGNRRWAAGRQRLRAGTGLGFGHKVCRPVIAARARWYAAWSLDSALPTAGAAWRSSVSSCRVCWYVMGMGLSPVCCW